MKARVVVAMSGGVDSSVAAALLKQQGYEVIGLTMCFNLPEVISKKPRCCGIQGIEDARRVAHKIGIRHYVLNFSKVLKDKVIKNFFAEYLKGRTPNPCIRCNQYLKFDVLLKKALSLEAGFLATGHYARITSIEHPCLPDRQGASSIEKYSLKKAKDLTKDQSYFLYRLNQNQLKHILFPLGQYSKLQVRRLAKKFALPVAEKPASQEICFLPTDNYRQFMQAQMQVKLKPGPIINQEGQLLGQHPGIPFYTIGQRQGLGIAQGYPLYIIKIDSRKNQIIVGRKEDAYKSRFFLKDLYFILKPKKKKIAVNVRIRYNHQEAKAEVIWNSERAEVRFRHPQFAITPGQSAVFYDKDKVLGGGIIDKVSN